MEDVVEEIRASAPRSPWPAWTTMPKASSSAAPRNWNSTAASAAKRGGRTSGRRASTRPAVRRLPEHTALELRNGHRPPAVPVPGTRQPEFWHDPRVFGDGDRKTGGVMHAKVVIIDAAAALVTSANFTEAAQSRNIEAGVVVRLPYQITSLRSYFEGLIKCGDLKAI